MDFLADVSKTQLKIDVNSTFPKGGVSFSKDSFEVNGILVFQIKFCGKIPTFG